MSKKKRDDLITTDDDSGEGTQGHVEQTYAQILRRLGIDTSNMTVEDVQNMIHDYTQEGRIHGNVVDVNFKTGEAKRRRKASEKEENYYHVIQDQDEPVASSEMAERKDPEYNKRSEKENKNSPNPPFNPKPKAP